MILRNLIAGCSVSLLLAGPLFAQAPSSSPMETTGKAASCCQKPSSCCQGGGCCGLKAAVGAKADPPHSNAAHKKVAKAKVK